VDGEEKILDDGQASESFMLLRPVARNFQVHDRITGGSIKIVGESA
jgi:hypothetical protein